VDQPTAVGSTQRRSYDETGSTASGRPYDAYIAEQILAPLGMVSSGFQLEGAQGHQDWFGLALPAAATVNEAMWPAGGLYSSAADMARYLAAQLDAGRGPNPILSTAGFAALHRPADVGDTGYALGWDTESSWGCSCCSGCRPSWAHRSGPCSSSTPTWPAFW